VKAERYSKNTGLMVKTISHGVSKEKDVISKNIQQFVLPIMIFKNIKSNIKLLEVKLIKIYFIVRI
jgi:hypothetical protein